MSTAAEKQFDQGLVNTIAAETQMSYIDGERGVLEYVGIDIDSLARLLHAGPDVGGRAGGLQSHGRQRRECGRRAASQRGRARCARRCHGSAGGPCW